VTDRIAVSVIGAGVMGSGIAQVLATAGFRTTCCDTSSEALSRAEDGVLNGRYGLRRGVERGKLTSEQLDQALSLLTFTDDLAQAAHVDLVVEAVFEDLGLKTRVFRDLDRLAPAGTVLTTNSSGFPIASLADATDRPGKVMGWHWASPVPVRQLAEIVVTPTAEPDAVALVVDTAVACGKNPIVVKDNPLEWGYVSSRVFVAAEKEALRILSEGLATAEEIDQLMVDCFGWPMGPLAMRTRTGANWE